MIKPEYYVSRATVDDEPGFQVAKFTGGDVPEKIYSMTARGERTDCDCPSPHRPCKHAKMVEFWLDAGEPSTPVEMVTVTIKVKGDVYRRSKIIKEVR